MNHAGEPSGPLAGRVAVITGASRGIGAAAARRLADDGASLVLAHEPTVQMREAVDALTDELGERLTTAAAAIAVPCDLADPQQSATLVDRAVDRFGRLDALIANAATTGSAPAHELAVSDWDRVVDVNLRGTWLLARAAFEPLAATGGSFVAVSSIMAATGQPGAVHYTASKAGIVGVVRALAREFGPAGVRVNAVMPGAIRTEAEEERWPDPTDLDRELLAEQALQRRGRADDLAGTFAYLVGDDSAFVTGQVICVDGGVVLR